MKKNLFALALSLAAITFFSCATTNGKSDLSAQNAADESGVLDTDDSQAQKAASAFETPDSANEPADSGGESGQGQEAAVLGSGGEASKSAESAPEEKIPESEMRELEALLNDNPAQGDSQSEGESGGRVQYGSLLEKIKAASKNDGENAAQSQDSDEKESARNSAQKSAVRVAPNNSGAANGGGAAGNSSAAGPTQADDGEKLRRVTSQGNTITSGPLIGPGSDATMTVQPANGNSNGTNNPAASSNFGGTDGAAREANEGIALAIPQAEGEEAVPQEEKPIPMPSRSMTVKNKQFVDIVYPGSGWIYLGEEDSGDRFIFQGRKLGNGETTFTLRSNKPGTSLLHFYKNDILTGNYIDDWIEITVNEKGATDAVHVTAPSYAEAVPPKFDRAKNTAEKEKAIAQAAAKKQAEREEKLVEQKAAEKTPAEKESPAAKTEAPPKKESSAEAAPAEKVQTVIQTAGQEKSESKQKTAVAGNNGPQNGGQAASPASSSQAAGSGASQKSQGGAAGNSAQSLLERARKAYDEERYEEALDLVQQFFESATEDFDAGLYLEGLILEAKSSVRNIKSAIDAYDTLLKNWPQSPYWRRANERAVYLKRFYIDIR